ncbi:MAG: 23S rRNA (guanosine(2251)-2'-O)-methyltransferase RlmB [Magnetospiraceae bacterium]
MTSHSKKNRRPPRSSGAKPKIGNNWLFGTHTVLAALANPQRKPKRLLATEEAARALPSLPLQPEISARLDLDTLLPPGAVHQGIALLCDPLPPVNFDILCDRWAEREAGIVVILDQANDPHNIGAVLRSAAAFGALAVVVPDKGTPEATGTLAKAASGALEKIPYVRITNLARTLGTLKEAGFWCVGLDGKATMGLPQADPGQKIALVLGSEGKGLRRLTAESCDLLFHIPMADSVESLNLSNAAAVALYALSPYSSPAKGSQ